MSDLRVRRRPSRKVRRRRLIVAVSAVAVAVLAIAGTAVAVNLNAQKQATPAASGTRIASPTPSATPTPTPTPTEETPAPVDTPVPVPAFNAALYSLDDPTSPWVVVDKLRPVPDAAAYVPPDLVDLRGDILNPNGHVMRSDAAAALAAMFDASIAETGIQLVAQSGYRSYDSQVGAYNYYVNLLGTEGADLTSARPGFSEHQTGMAMDILDTVSGCSVDGPCFGSTTSGQWLAANAYRFGFILRYPADKTAVTGYEYEPWHFRWVGVELSTEMHNTGVTTLEEFFGLPAAPGY